MDPEAVDPETVEFEVHLKFDPHDWDLEPWVREFRERIQDVWETPPSYMRGGTGAQRIRMRIERSGDLVSYDLLEREGDPFLAHSTERCLRSAAPYPMLPPACTSDTLEVILRIEYPPLDP